MVRGAGEAQFEYDEQVCTVVIGRTVVSERYR